MKLIHEEKLTFPHPIKNYRQSFTRSIYLTPNGELVIQELPDEGMAFAIHIQLKPEILDKIERERNKS